MVGAIPMFLVALVCELCAGTAAADEIICPRVAQAPVLDGRLDDACWQVAAQVTDFTRPLSEAPSEKGVSAKACFNAEALYLAFLCAEANPERIKAVARDGGADVWKDDCVEIWLCAGESQLEYDQFIVNAKGMRQAVRVRPAAASTDWHPDWQAKGRIGQDHWSVEIAIPFSCLGMTAPAAGALIQVKLGREDYARDGQDLATWPPRSPYGKTEGAGRLYFETANLLPNPDMSEQREGKVAAWGFGEKDAGLFASVEDEGRRVIRFDTQDRYAVAEQTIRLKPDSVYRLSARVRGAAGVYMRARTGPKSTPHTARSKPSAEYQDCEVRFPTGADGRALIIIGNYQGLGRGEVFISDLKVSQDVGYEADGPAVPLDGGLVVEVKKLLVTDCRALKGFVVAPVDGRFDSYNWNMAVWEYNMRGAGAGVGYRYRNSDGLHITLADDEGVDAVQIRKGARVKLYADAERYDDPGDAPLVWRFKGKAKTSRALFPQRVKSDRFSFFELEDGRIADVSFLRVSRVAEFVRSIHSTLTAGGVTEPGDLAASIARRFSTKDPVHELAADGGAPIRAEAKQTIHLIGEPLPEELPLRSLGVHLTVPDAPTGCPLTVAVQDPLNPRQELMGVDFTIERAGSHTLVMDFPDQVIPAGKRLWLSLTFGAPLTIEEAKIELHSTPRERALPEALAFRKLMMRGLFCELSEARQWTTIREKTDLEKFYRENHWGPGVKELHETIAQCKAFGLEDDTVRCYDDWVWRRARELPKFEPRIDDVPSAPEWAVLARQAWLTAREVPKWWLDNRVVPTGEFGGLVGDDTDMYQNYADFPMFETDGVATEIKRAAANLAELAEEENLEQGLNKRTMDPLHAYEEGVNHEALMMLWNYGDPVYFERCLLAAKSMPALTVVTEKGHRHFKNQDCGAQDLRFDRELGIDGHAHPLMLHPCFEVGWYNRNPQVIQFLREWGDGWLEHLKPGEYATSVDVKTEQATATSGRALDGGYGGQGSAHNFLYWLTDDLKYIRPFMDFFEQGKDNWPARKYVPELWHRGALDGLEPGPRESVLRGNHITCAIALGDRQRLLDALKADIAELQRFRTMYTDAEVFTDRVFLKGITNAAQCYTGGYATRNKYNHTHAASWEGFGTDYAALVLRARRDHFKALIYNFREEPMSGAIRLWTLDHGRYRLTLGPDGDGDETARQETLAVGRATAIPLTLPAKTVMVLELEQVERLDDLWARPDLAIAAREIRVREGIVSGIVHNIGGSDAPSFTIALLDAEGRERKAQTLGPLAAPLDLEPKRIPFRFEDVGKDVAGWKVVVDAGDEIAEVFEGNNNGNVF